MCDCDACVGIEAVQALLEEQREEFESKLEEQRQQYHNDVDELRDELADVKEDKQILEQRVDLLVEDLQHSDGRIAELQSRELEKNAHLRWENIEPAINGELLEVDSGRVERFHKEDGEYARIPGVEDELESGGPTMLASDDRLPIQQLVRMDDDVIRANVNTVQARLAIKVWQERENDEKGLWRTGGGPVREFFYASDLTSFIRDVGEGITHDYAKKLTSRTIDAFLQLSKNRVTVKKKNRRKDGLRYKERRVILPKDAGGPGEPPYGGDAAPETVDVHGD